MTTKIYIIRHSQTDYNVAGRHDHEGKAMITESGKQRADKIAELLSNIDIDVIYSSPLPRCVDTIQPLAHALGQEIQIDTRLRENFLGPIQDKLWSDFPREFLDEVHDINGKEYEGYEHMKKVYERVADCIDSIGEKHAGKTVVICSHAGPIAHLISYIDQKPAGVSPAHIVSNTGVTHQDAYIVREI